MGGLHNYLRRMLAAPALFISRNPNSLLPRLWAPPWPSPCASRMSHTQALLDILARKAKRIPVKGDHVSVLDTPGDFYQAIKDGVQNARERVVIASLYIGTGKLEEELLDVVADALADNPALRVTMLFDALRATRPTHDSVNPRFTSSATMISSVLLSKSARWQKLDSTEGQERLKVALYRTPDLTRTLQWILPARVNEVVGVCHLKAFVFDDHVLMTGANLSSSYFSNRQDRYIWFRDSACLAQHISSLIDTVASYSFTLGVGGEVLLPSAISLKDSHVLRNEMASSVQQLLPSLTVQPRLTYCEEEECDTWLFPTVQMGPLGIRQDEQCTLSLFGGVPAGTLLQFSSAYFNLTPEYERLFLQAAQQNYVEILTASPQANGFYGSTGISGLIPRAYSLLEQNLFERALQIELGDSDASISKIQSSPEQKGGLSIYEYERSGWTFHAKGLWCTLPGDDHGPTVTLIGSSNFGYRSRDRDLETQVFLVTKNSTLSEQLKLERDALYARAVKVNASSFSDPERAGGWLASISAQLVRSWL